MPSERTVVVLFVAVALGKTREIEPVPRSTFTEVRTGEQAIDHALKRLGIGIGNEGVDLGRRRWQPYEIERQATQQDPAISSCSWRDVGALLRHANELVDWCARP